MKTYILLFRGINVGGKNILPMKDLALLLGKTGCKNVKTYIQSGNVVTNSTKKPGAEIYKAIEAKYGFKPDVVVLEKSEFETAIKNNPFQSDEGKSIHFYFTGKNFKPDMDRLAGYSSSSEQYEIKGCVFYLHAPDGIGRSKLVANLETCLGVAVTGRNLNTIRKLAEIAECSQQGFHNGCRIIR